MAEGRVLAEGTPEEMKRRTTRAGQGEPTMEEAFISLLETKGNQEGRA